MAISLTESAAREIQSLIDANALPAGTALRIGVKSGGCSGLTYVLDLCEGAGEDDEVFEDHGLTVVCDPKSYLFMTGTTVDFRDEPMGRGFVFDNPNASGTCGCGSSFTA